MDKPKVGEKYRVEIFTGKGHVNVTATIRELLGNNYVMIEFPHPTVRRFTASRPINVNSLGERII